MMPFFKNIYLWKAAKISLLAISSLWPSNSTAQTQCSIALVLALDVSGSVDSTDFHLQKNGIINAFTDSDVIDLITILPGGISVAITHWSGIKDQRVAVDWHNIRNITDAFTFSKKIDNDKRVRTGSLTAIGSALFHAYELHNSNLTLCRRKVIDISSDGRSNRGVDPNFIADILLTKSIIINALVITGDNEILATYFQKNVIRGAGSFVETTNNYDDYAKAIKRKLLRELAPNLAHFRTPPPVNNVVATKLASTPNIIYGAK